jgi:hypothetical protein
MPAEQALAQQRNTWSWERMISTLHSDATDACSQAEGAIGAIGRLRISALRPPPELG